jgi:hypothetical protein
VNPLLESLSFWHINVVEKEYALSQDGMNLFGVLDLETLGDGFSFSLGLRNANDISMRLGLVVGVQVLCCDNMAFSGGFAAEILTEEASGDTSEVGIPAISSKFSHRLSEMAKERETMFAEIAIRNHR